MSRLVQLSIEARMGTAAVASVLNAARHGITAQIAIRLGNAVGFQDLGRYRTIASCRHAAPFSFVAAADY